MHLDIKPSNFLVDEEAGIKLCDFNLARKKGNFNDDIYEGDSIYMSPELLKANHLCQLNEKCDIFSLGLSILEIVCRIELPPNGEAWRFIRSGNFSLTKDYFNNSNLRENPADIIQLIQDMIRVNSNERKDLNTIIEEYPELKNRSQQLIDGTYQRNASLFAKRTRSFSDKRVAKRSDSYKSNQSIF